MYSKHVLPYTGGSHSGAVSLAHVKQSCCCSCTCSGDLSAANKSVLQSIAGAANYYQIILLSAYCRRYMFVSYRLASVVVSTMDATLNGQRFPYVFNVLGWLERKFSDIHE